MKTKEYIKKYELSVSDSFDHNMFIGDLAIDFIALVEFSRAKASEFTTRNFETCVEQIRDKFDSVNNKTVGFIPEYVWDKFYKSVVTEARKELFPEDEARRNKILDMSDDELTEFVNSYGFFFYSPSHQYRHIESVKTRDWEKANKLHNEILLFALGELDIRLKRAEKIYKEKRQKEWEEESRKYREQRQREHDWFNRLLFGSLFSGMAVPSESFKMLGIADSYSEEEVKKAYRTLSLKHHPDRGGNQQAFIDLTEAKNKCLAYIGNKS